MNGPLQKKKAKEESYVCGLVKMLADSKYDTIRLEVRDNRQKTDYNSCSLEYTLILSAFNKGNIVEGASIGLGVSEKDLAERLNTELEYIFGWGKDRAKYLIEGDIPDMAIPVRKLN